MSNIKPTCSYDFFFLVECRRRRCINGINRPVHDFTSNLCQSCLDPSLFQSQEIRVCGKFSTRKLSKGTFFFSLCFAPAPLVSEKSHPVGCDVLRATYQYTVEGYLPGYLPEYDLENMPGYLPEYELDYSDACDGRGSAKLFCGRSSMLHP